MEKIEIYYKPEVEQYINELIFALYKENYFSYLENAIRYKDKIIDFIENNILNFPYRLSPFELKNYGSKYIFYNSNSRTTWYIFYENRNNKFLITFITNNHTKIAKFI